MATALSVSLSGALQVLARLAREYGEYSDACLVGGSLRDALLGRPIADVDIVASNPRALAEATAAALDSRVVEIGAQLASGWRGRGELLRIPLDGGDHLDLTQMHPDGLDADLAARDFTVNAFALPLARLPAQGLGVITALDLEDRHGSLADLEARVLRLVGPRTLEDDPLRALRGVRLACELDFALEPATLAALGRAVEGLQGVARERVGGELTRLFAAPGAARGVRLLDEAGLLGFCFGSFEDGRGVEQRPWHRYDVLEHQLVAVEWMDALLATSAPADPEHAEAWRLLWGAPWPSRWGEVREHARKHAATLRLATLLHDIGKPATRTIEVDGRTRFFGHPELGAEMAEELLARWAFPLRTIERVSLLVREHLRPGQVASPGQPPTRRALYRFQRALGDATPDVCLLFLADSLATAGADQLLPRWPAYVAHVRGIVSWRPPEAPDGGRLVDGHAVMRATGLPPGPEVGRVIEAVEEAAGAGEVETPAEAIAYAQAIAERLRERGEAPRDVGAAGGARTSEHGRGNGANGERSTGGSSPGRTSEPASER